MHRLLSVVKQISHSKQQIGSVHVSYSKVIESDDGDVTHSEMTQYDESSAEQYKKMQNDFTWHISSLDWTLFESINKIIDGESSLNAIKNDNNLSIIDIACGTGITSRFLSDHITNYNVSCLGVDIAEAQIKMARKLTSKSLYPNIKYEVGDARYLGKDEYKHLNNKFDIAVSMWCFDYAHNVNALNNMMKSVYNVLKPNGFAIGVTQTHDTPNLIYEKYGSDNYDEYGFLWCDCHNKNDGDLISLKLASLNFSTYFYFVDTYKNVAKKNGFQYFKLLCDDDNDFKYVANPQLNEKEQEMYFNRMTDSAYPLPMFVMRK